MAIIGIDLGTTNSLAAVWKDGLSVLIPNAAGEFLTPSAVSVDEDGTILVGRSARDRLITHPTRTAAAFKRFMGTEKRFTLAGRSFLPEELSSLVLRRLREDAEVFLGEPVTEAVVSVPAYFNEAQRAATKRAGDLAGLVVERLVNEPSAAAVACHIEEGPEDKVCLVFDFGGGTLDVSLVERFENVVSVTAVSGDNRLGGHDFDELIARGFCEDCGLDFGNLSPQKRESIIRQAEQCKMALTIRDSVLMAVSGDGLSASLSLSNTWLIRKCAPLFQRMVHPIQRALMDGGVSAAELNELILVGGSSHMPSVRRYISKTLGVACTQSAPPDTAVALGVGICSGIKARAADLRELVLTDVCPFTLGVNVHNEGDADKDLMSPIIERNCILPSSKENTYHTIRDNQTILDIKIYQGEAIYCADNTLLGQISFPVPPAPKGTQRARVRFTYDINSLLEVEVTSDDGRRKRLLIQNAAYTLRPEELQKRLKELHGLKFHPRETEENRQLLARGQRLYTMTLGSVRDQVMEVMTWFDKQLTGQEPHRIAKAAKRADKFFDQLEVHLGISDPPPLDWMSYLDGGDAP